MHDQDRKSAGQSGLRQAAVGRNQSGAARPVSAAFGAACAAAAEEVPDERALARRVDIRVDFPDLICPDEPQERLLPTVAAELAKQGESLAGVGTIHIAYPHKHPGLFPGHENAALNHAVCVAAFLRAECPDVTWVLDDGLCETVHLKRSEQQNSLHALTAKQFYVLEPDLQSGPLPFAADNGRRDYFIIVDQFTDQGTTVANLMSYIHNRGGFVLAAVTGDGTLVQYGAPVRDGVQQGLSATFTDAARNTGRLPELADVLSASAAAEGLAVTPDAALRTLEEKLARHGHSLFALTDGECRRLRGLIGQEYSTCVETGWYTPYTAVMKALDDAPLSTPPAWPALLAAGAGVPVLKRA